MNSREVIKRIKADGWFEVRQTGSHKHFKHSVKKGVLTVVHPRRDCPIGTLKKMENISGLKFR